MTSEREENCFFFGRMFCEECFCIRWMDSFSLQPSAGPQFHGDRKRKKHWEILVPAPRPSAPRKLAFRSQWRQLHPHTFAPGLFAVGDPCNTWLTHGLECGHKWPGLQHTTGQTQPSPANVFKQKTNTGSCQAPRFEGSRSDPRLVQLSKHPNALGWANQRCWQMRQPMMPRMHLAP